MRKVIFWSLCVWLVLGAFSCRKNPPPPPAPSTIVSLPAPPAYVQEEGGILLRINASAELNAQQGSPRAVLACVHQLRDTGTYERLLQNEAGLKTLLSCASFDASIAGSRQFVIQPDQQVEYSLIRLEGAKAVGVVVGYRHLTRETSARLMEVPVLQINTGDPLNPVALRLDRLRIDLNLGPEAIQ